MEHDVYLCTWTRSSEAYTLWLKSRPTIRGVGSTYAQAEEILIEAIQDSGGAAHAVLEYDPPLPNSDLETKYANPELFLIGGDDRFEIDLPKRTPFSTTDEKEARLKLVDEFFESPVCRKCFSSSSPRSGKPLPLRYALRKFDGGFGNVGNEGTNMLHIYSQEFLDLLHPVEKRQLEFRPVAGKGRGRFYELTGPCGLSRVAVAGIKVNGWRCVECDRRTFGCWIEGMSIHSFIAKTDLPESPSNIFTVGDPPDLQIAVTARRWKELVGRKGTRGFTSRLLGVVPNHELARHPGLPTYEERLREG